MTQVQPPIPDVDVRDGVLLWQHNNADLLQDMAAGEQAWFAANGSGFWSDWYRDVFNLDTANDFGLHIWAIILNVPMLLSSEADGPGKRRFGFGRRGRYNFNSSNFAAVPGTGVKLMPDQMRLALKLRYFQITSRASVPEINQFLKALFGDKGGAYALDPGDMSLIVYVFKYTPDSGTQMILQKMDLLPRPATVGMKIVIAPDDVFGFEATHKNFTAPFAATIREVGA